MSATDKDRLNFRFRKGLRTKAQKAANATHDGNLTAWLNDLIEKTTNKLPS